LLLLLVAVVSCRHTV